ncbi:MAG: dihydropteroate synthase [Burkholderiales bacterium]
MGTPHALRLTPHPTLHAGRFILPLERPLIVGVVNVTPDSFSDGGRFFGAQQANDHAQRLIDEGVDILDVGGESSRPGATPISAEEELRRVLPVVEKFAPSPVPISVDTCKPEVISKAIAAGASMINDIYALRSPGALEAVLNSQAAVCLMHMQGEPRTMQEQPAYKDVVGEVLEFLRQRIEAALQSGIARQRIVVDPGFGFGKTREHNFELLSRLREFGCLGVPIYAGLSRKSLLKALTGRSVEQRLPGSIALAMVALQNGARLLRVHDVAATRDAVAVFQASRPADGATL